MQMGQGADVLFTQVTYVFDISFGNFLFLKKPTQLLRNPGNKYTSFCPQQFLQKKIINHLKTSYE
jgi:hypothetical protein